MNKKDTLRKIKEMDTYATKLCVDLIESEARKLMYNKGWYDVEFFMAMGSCFFIDKDKTMISNCYGELNGKQGMEDVIEFFDMVYLLNEKWNIMGFPMRFTVNGEKRTNW
jgi:hypothetical protein